MTYPRHQLDRSFSFLELRHPSADHLPLSFILPREKLLRFISSIIATLALVLLLIGHQVFQLFKFHLNGQVWQLLLDQAQTEEGSIWSIIFVAVPAIFLLQLLLSAYVAQISKRKRRQYGNQVGLALLVCLILTHLVNSWADATLYQPITMQRANFPLPPHDRQELPGQAMAGLTSSSMRRRPKIRGSAGDRLSLSLCAPLSVSAPSDHKNRWWWWSALRADMLNNINMPNLQRYADNHFNFRQYMSGGNDETMGMFSPSSTGCPATITGTSGLTSAPCCSTRCCVRTTSSACSVHWKMPSSIAKVCLRVCTGRSSSRQTDDRRLIDDWRSGLARAPRTDPGSLWSHLWPGDYQVPASIKGAPSSPS